MAQSAGQTVVTIYHNPACGTSRNALQAIRDAGVEPRIVRYLEQGWDRAQLERLLSRMKMRPRQILRIRGTPAEALGLTAASADDDAILAAMIEHPILVERPIVETAKGAALCRPWEKVGELL